MIRNFFITLLILILGIVFFGFMVLFAVPALQESTFVLPKITETSSSEMSAGTDKDNLESDISKLKTQLDKLTPTEAYIVINTSDNHFYLYQGKQMIREGKCSTGKNEKLVSEKGDNTFYTPQGVRKVLRKQKNPVWAKPNWAFIEEGLPIPPAGHPSRFEAGTLGDYKLELGNGYMIHGTIYKRFIGQSVTHGCIRMLDDDLEAVYNTLAIGSKVYIY
jgi:lipoprotein-anchoring transpeptidase ErfK/SrfK